MKKLTLLLLILAFTNIIVFGQYALSSKASDNSTATKKALRADVNPNAQFSSNYVPETGNLDFSIQGTRAFLYSNGPLVTDVGTGPGGADYSLLEAPNTNWGVGTSIATGYMISDDFMVNATSWTIDSIAFFAYQTGEATAPSTFTDYHVMILDGAPDAGGSVIWGDTTNNIMLYSAWSGIYRGSDLANSERPIMRSMCDIGGQVLPGGQYWLVYRCDATGASGPWAPLITISGTPATGDAFQHNGTAWAPITDGGGGQGLPFEIYGTEVAATCPFPINIIATNVEDVSADIGWTETGSATTWDIEFGAAGFSPTGTPTNIGVTTNPFSFTGLTAGTSYDFYVRADCGSGDYSLWTGPYTFNTLNCPSANMCDLEIIMTDDYEDGWNGAYISVLEGGIEIAQLTCAGAGGTEFVPVCDGQTIDLVWYKGSYDYEVSFIVNNPFGGTLFTAALGDPDGWTDAYTFHTFTSSCVQPAYDMAVTGVTPLFVISGDDGIPALTVKNNGASTQTTYSVRVMISGTAYDEFIDVTTPLATNTSTTHTFPTWTAPAIGSYNITALVYNVTGDADPNNDTIIKPCQVADLNYTAGDLYTYNAATDESGLIPVSSGVLSVLTVPVTGDFLACGEYVDGIVYGFEYVTNVVYIMLPDGEVVQVGVLNGLASITGFAYDQAAGIMYASSWDGTNSNLYTVDASWDCTLVGVIGTDLVIGIATDDLGNLYGIDITASNFSSIDKATGAATVIGSTGTTLAYAQDIGGDHESGIIYGTIYDTAGRFGSFDVATGTFTEITDLTDEFTMCAVVPTDPLNITTLNHANNINIYPNPTTGTLNISNAENADVVIYNMLGEVVLSVNNITRIIDISELAEGTYIVKVVTENNVTTQKVNLLK